MMNATRIDLRGIDLPALVEQDKVNLRGNGQRYCAPCPNCGGRDRFYLTLHSDDVWTFTCNANCKPCSAKGNTSGDAIAYLRWRNPGMSFPDACAALGVAREAQRHRAPRKPTRPAFVPIERRADTWQDAAADFALRCSTALWDRGAVQALTYLRGRGFTDDTLRVFDIGWHDPGNGDKGVKLAGQWWAWRGVTIPRSYAGNVWAVNVRRWRSDIEDDGGSGKYRMLQGGTPGALFNADRLITESQRGGVHTVIVTGGEFDTMSVMQCAPAGVHAVTLGGEGATPDAEHIHILRDFDVLACLDSDAAGDAGAAKWLAAIPGARRIVSPIGKDLNDFLRSGADLRAWLAGQVHFARDVDGATINDMIEHGYNVSIQADGRLFAEPMTKRGITK
jgi:hypothetical protein